MYSKWGRISKKDSTKLRTRDMNLCDVVSPPNLQEDGKQCFWERTKATLRELQEAGQQYDSESIVMFCLKACSSVSDDDKGQEIHMELVEEGFDSGYLVGSALASRYAKCDLTVEAHGVFDELDTPKVISGTTLLTNHPLHGHACSRTGAIDKRKVHEGELHGWLKQDPILGNTWVHVWAKSSSFVRANDKIGVKGRVGVQIIPVFSSSGPNTEPEVLREGCIKSQDQGQSNIASQEGDSLKEVWIKEEKLKFSVGFESCEIQDKSTNRTANEKFDESALDVVAKMVQQDKKDIQVGKAKEKGLDVLTEALCAKRKMLVALETELEKERNLVSIATSKTMAMISRLQEEKSAMQLVVAQLQRMAEEKAEYNEHAIALLKEILFKREAKKQALEKNLIMDTWGALVLATKPPTDDILLRPLVGQKEPLISLIGGYGHIQEALELANLMQRHGISLNVVTYLCGLKACTNLEGKGSKTRAFMKCTGCQGLGMKASIRQLGPGMIQQMQHGCRDCKGSGETLSEKEKCTQCKGEKVVQNKKMLEVHAEKGMQHNQKITILGEANKAPDTVIGDIVCVLQLKEHAKFKRKGDDLFVEHTLNLQEAPCGFQFVIVYLDGRKLLIKPAPRKIVKTGKPRKDQDQAKRGQDQVGKRKRPGKDKIKPGRAKAEEGQDQAKRGQDQIGKRPRLGKDKIKPGRARAKEAQEPTKNAMFTTKFRFNSLSFLKKEQRETRMAF
ncbi:hypothetical protein L7F22_000738 [Adiantum nelumboides]|nr:hypothetical protein [Adiantum nelumboides]